MRGKLIVLEGLDKAGKSTQCARLAEKLQAEGHQVRSVRFPDRTTPIGRMIDAYLKGQSEQEDHVIHLLFSANRWELAKSIEADIANGVTVVIDRYYYSGCVYSAAKNNPTLGLAWARHPDVGLPRPDVCLFLDLSSEEAAKRGGGYGEERYESQQTQERVRALFAVLQSSGSDKDDFLRIDAGRGSDEVLEDVLQAVHAVMDRVDALALPLRRVDDEAHLTD